MLYWYSERRGRTKRLMLRLVARTADQQRHIADQQASIESLIDTQQHLISQINDTQHKLRDTGMCIADPFIYFIIAMRVHQLGLYCILFRRFLISKINLALQLTKL